VLHGGDTPLGHAFFAANDNLVAAVDQYAGLLRLWRLPDGAPDSVITQPRLVNAALAADGRVALLDSNAVTIRDLATRRLARTFSLPAPGLSLVAWALRDSAIVLAGAGSRAYIVRLSDTGRVASAIALGTSGTTALAVSPDGRVAASGGADHVVRIWSIASGRDTLARTITGHGAPITGCAFLDPDSLLTVADDGSVRIWNVRSGDELNRIRLSRATVTAASRHGAAIAVGDGSGGLWLFDRRDVASKPKPLGSGAGLVAAAFAHDSPFVATASDTLVRVWHNVTGRLLWTLHGSSRFLHAIAFDPTDSMLASVGDEGAVRLWSLRTGRELRALPGGRGAFDVAFSPDGRLVAAAGADDSVRVWRLTTGELSAAIPHPRAVQAVAFLDSKTLITAGADGIVRGVRLGDESAVSLWSLDSLRGHGVKALAIQPSTDGSRVLIVAASLNGDVRLWHLDRGRPAYGGQVTVGPGLIGGLTILSSADDTHPLIAISTGANILLWRASAAGFNQIVDTLGVHTADVRALASSPSQSLLMSASDDGTARLWRLHGDSATLLLTRAAIDSADWVAVSADGRFEGSQGGLARLHYVRGLETIPLDAFFARDYTPGLSGVVLRAGGSSLGIPKPFSPPPLVSLRVDRTERDRLTLTLRATDKGGGAKALRLFQNGTVIAGLDTDGTHVPADANAHLTYQDESCDTICRVTVTLVPGINVFEATAFSNQWIEAERADTTVIGPGVPTASRLFVLAVGVTEYPKLGPSESLGYAATDAAEVAKALDSAASPVYGSPRRVLLRDAEATPQAILDTLRRFAHEARPQDAFVFYYSGHGTVAGRATASRFYLALGGTSSLDDERQLEQNGIDATTLKRAIEAIPALKKVLIVDACRSGTFVGQVAVAGTPATGTTHANKTQQGSVARDARTPRILSARLELEQQAVAWLARSTGVLVMSASAPESAAFELEQLHHAALTSALLDALAPDAGAAPRVRTVRSMATTVEQLVPGLTLKYRGSAQYPLVWSFGEDWPIGIR
jgi:WD40 repeat protein